MTSTCGPVELLVGCPVRVGNRCLKTQGSCGWSSDLRSTHSEEQPVNRKRDYSTCTATPSLPTAHEPPEPSAQHGASSRQYSGAMDRERDADQRAKEADNTPPVTNPGREKCGLRFPTKPACQGRAHVAPS